MNDQLTDLVRHFIGYWHLDDLTGKSTVLLNGSGQSGQTEEVASSTEPVLSDLKTTLDLELTPVVDAGYNFSSAFLSPVVRLPDNPLVLHYTPPPTVASSPSPDGPTASAPYAGVPLFQTLYPTVADLDISIHISQHNSLVDNDHVIFEGADQLKLELTVEMDLALDNMMQAVKLASDGLVADPLHEAAKVPVAQIHSKVAYIPVEHEAGNEAEYVAQEFSALEGRHLDSSHDEDDFSPEPVGAELEETVVGPQEAESEQVDIYEDELQIRLEGHIDRPETQIGSDNDEDEAEGSQTEPEPIGSASEQIGAPTGAGSIDTALGENLSINSSQIVEVSDGHGSLIVEGDYHEVNTIVQINVLADDDRIEAPAATENSDEAGENLSINDAQFSSSENLTLGQNYYGDQPQGSGWNVTLHEGNYYDVTSVFQQNSLIDNDIAQLVSTNSALSLVTGDNIQVNDTNVFTFADAYDLIIVAGDYNEFNTIIQVNLLVDNDALYIEGESDIEDESVEGSLEAEPAGFELQTSDNGQYNSASITNIGGEERFEEINSDVEELIEFAQGDEDELTPELTQTLPGNGGESINVLFVTGDFYDLTSITQVNVTFDMDLLQVNRGEFGDPLGAADRDFSTGQNTQLNDASILDVDSPSSYQFLGGEYYEDSLLVQTNILMDEDELVFEASSDLSDENISFLTAEGEHETGAEQQDHFEAGSSFDGDVMGSMLG